MTQLTVPEPFRPGLQKLAYVDDAAIGPLLDALRSERPTLESDWIRRVASQADGLEPDDVREIIGTAIALYSVRMSLGESIPDFVEDLSEAENIDIPEDRKQRFKGYLTQLLNIDVLAIASKARDVLNDYPNNLHDTRILTDMRPVFRDDATGVPAAAAIIHTLKIRYHLGRDQDLQEFFVAMSPSDVQMLRDTLDRAEVKAHGLQQILEAAHVPQLLQVGTHVAASVAERE